MITSVEFDAALKLIAEYKMQSVKKIKLIQKVRNRTINLQKLITSGAYTALRSYYKNEYHIVLDWNKLGAMDKELLSTIEFDKLLQTRGFGRTALYNLKKTLVFNSVINNCYLNQ